MKVNLYNWLVPHLVVIVSEKVIPLRPPFDDRSDGWSPDRDVFMIDLRGSSDVTPDENDEDDEDDDCPVTWCSVLVSEAIDLCSGNSTVSIWLLQQIQDQHYWGTHCNIVSHQLTPLFYNKVFSNTEPGMGSMYYNVTFNIFCTAWKRGKPVNWCYINCQSPLIQVPSTTSYKSVSVNHLNGMYGIL